MSDLTTEIANMIVLRKTPDEIIAYIRAKDRYDLIKQDLTDGVRADERASFKAEVIESFDDYFGKNEYMNVWKSTLIKHIEEL